MAYNNSVILIGNMNSDARIIDTGESHLVVFSLATTEIYKIDLNEQVDKATVWHNILVFNPKLIDEIMRLEKGARLEISGLISYRPFEVKTNDGNVITKNEASIMTYKFVKKPFVKKAP